MARFVWANGNRGFYGYDQLAAYDVSALSVSGATLDFSGTADPDVFAARIKLTFSGATTYVVETGPDAGETRFVTGVLTGATYLAEDGSTLLSVTGLKVHLPIFLQTLARGDSTAAWAMMTTGVNSITGSNTAASAGHAGTGDVIATGSLADVVHAGGGDDFVKDMGGADSYDGGTGFDTLSYEAWYYQPQSCLTGLVADLASGTVAGPDGRADQITGFEAVNGTFRADRISGNSVGNWFAGLGGADRIDGRAGFDFVTYAFDADQGGRDGIRVSLASGTVRDGFGSRDTVISIEGVIGTAWADTFYDSGANNWVDGGAGDDTLRFGDGNDTAKGGAGEDLFIFRGTIYGDDRILDFSDDEGDQILFDAATSFSQLHLASVSGGVEVTFGSGLVFLAGVSLSELSPADFGF